MLDIGVAIFLSLLPHNSDADTLTNRPSADTTLFEADPDNNLGVTDLTSGSTAASLRSRALIQFDFAETVPSEATANSVTLTLTATRQPSGGVASNYRLFRLLQPWGEGDKTGVHGARLVRAKPLGTIVSPSKSEGVGVFQAPGRPLIFRLSSALPQSPTW